MAKVNCCRDQQLPCSLWLGLQASWSHQTWHGHGQGMGLAAAVVRLIVPYQGSAGRRHDLPPSSCEMAKVNCCRDQQLPCSLWLGLQASWSHQTWHGHGQGMGLAAAVVRLIVPYQGSAGRRHDLPPSSCEMAKVNCCRDQQLPCSLWLGLQASWSHQTWHGHGQGMGLAAAVVRLIVPYQGSAGRRHDLPPSSCEMAKVNCCRDQQLPCSLWLGLQASWSHQTWHGHGQGMGLAAAVVRLIVPYQGSAGRRHDLPPSSCEMAKVNCCRDQQLPCSLWLGLQASWSHQTWHGHGQGMGLAAAVVRLIVPYQGSAGRRHDLPPSSCEMAKVNCCRDQQLPCSLWLGLQASWSHQTWHGHGQGMGLAAAVVRLIVPYQGSAGRRHDLPPSSCEMAKVNCCRDQQLPCSLWLGLQASWSHQTWHGHGQGMGLAAAVVRLIVPYQGSAGRRHDLPPSSCEMAKVNCCRDQQLPCSLWLGLQASWSHQTWHGHGQGMGLGAAVVRLIVFYQGWAGRRHDLPPS